MWGALAQDRQRRGSLARTRGPVRSASASAMNTGPALRDIRVPPVSWWPPAIGWWLLAALVLIAIVA
ncbi:MAG TPA: DUF4381 family protein, partial [Rhodanobacteraceae bacterium]|nr:DUF4381 family protein [Rhodanobacteraceae bacterium]